MLKLISIGMDMKIILSGADQLTDAIPLRNLCDDGGGAFIICDITVKYTFSCLFLFRLYLIRII